METPINSNFKADSLKLRVPIEELKKGLFERSELDRVSKTYIVSDDYSEADYYQVNAVTGEISSALNEIPNSEKIINSIELSNDGGITKLIIFVESTRINGIEMQKCISFAFNTKFLKEKYFEGIMANNIEFIADYIRTATDKHGNRYEIPIEVLLNGYVTDLDICRDYEMNRDDFEKFINEAIERVKPSKVFGKGYKKFKPKDNIDNQGIQFSHRVSATPTNPFLKFYNKRLDMLAPLHNEFFEYYFNYNELNTPNIVRAEFTIKNKHHFKRYDIEGTQLKDVIGINEERWQSIYNTVLSNHFDKRTRPSYNVGGYNLINNICRLTMDEASGAIKLDKDNIEMYLNYYLNIGASERTRRNNKLRINDALNSLNFEVKNNDIYTQILDF